MPLARRRRRALSTTLAGAVALSLAPRTALADGAQTVVTAAGCYGIASYGVGLFGDGQGSVTVNPPGSILGVYLHWVGVEDDTPPSAGTSTLKVNGVDVVGISPTPPADFSPASGWFSWWANIGPGSGPFPGLDLIDDARRTVDISEWDTGSSSFPASNGATVTVIYDLGACSPPRQLEIQVGVDYYYYGDPTDPWSDLLVFTFLPAAVDRVVTFHLSHAGTDATQSNCRGGAVWMLAGTGAAPAPAFDIFEPNGGGRGRGINSGVEILNDPFTNASLPCTPSLNPAPDEPYEAGHPCPAGAAGCPYHALALRPAGGGDVGAEWAVVEVDTLIPANSEWVAFQLESEADQNGESGSWSGAGFVLAPFGVCGDGVLDPGEQCDDGNTVDGDGCSSTCQTSCQSQRPPDVVCAERRVCTDPGQCQAAISCAPGVAVVCDPDGDPVTITCAPGSPFGLGTTDVVVTASDGSNVTTRTCPVEVRDCEPPVCTAPGQLVLECSGPCGITLADPRIQVFLAGFSASDNCSVATTTLFAPPGFLAGCGSGTTTSVGYHAVDGVGLQAFCSADLVVVDSTPPAIVCPPPLVLDCPGPGGVPADDPRILVWLASAKATDICGEATISHNAPALFPPGCGTGMVTVVEFRATDACGNAATCSSTVTVVAETPTIEACDRDLCFWPPDHKYICFDDFTKNVRVEDACDSTPITLEVDCMSSQCDDAPCSEHPGENGDGNTVNDCIYDPTLDQLCVRSERAGTDQGGRFYSVSVVARNSCGASTPSTVLTVYVPHDQSDHDACIAPPPNSPK